ncbi:MAG: AAA family ATPase [Epsilonproteobacteria bacterium]|nr:AAA family ATPase [Campylobacterota bacterium]
MVKRLFVKELLSFDKIDLEFDSNLVVFSGPSGAGKSLLMGSLLALFGFENPKASLSEIELIKPSNLDTPLYDLEDIISIKAIKKERLSYYIDSQKISKKALKELFKDYIFYLSVRDKNSLESSYLLNLIDQFLIQKDSDFKELLLSYKERFNKFIEAKRELEEFLSKEQERKEKIEFIKFEIDKINKIEPKEGEYEELLKIKQQLSKLDKINEALSRAQLIFEAEESVYEVFELLGKDSSYFSEAMNQLRSDFEDTQLLADELLEVNIEELLNRLEELDSLIKRFGSIKEALEYREEKSKELEKLEAISISKKELEEFVENEEKELLDLALKISQKRKEEVLKISSDLKDLLAQLKLAPITFIFSKSEMGIDGVDRVNIDMQGSKLETLSGGEFNRLRLALMAYFASKDKEGVIFLDEIDANVSGEESIAIASLLKKLSKNYQIFAISHQPHLSSMASVHILVDKKDGKSFAKILKSKERVNEIARIIGGDNPSLEAVEFAKKLLKE